MRSSAWSSGKQRKLLQLPSLRKEGFLFFVVVYGLFPATLGLGQPHKTEKRPLKKEGREFPKTNQVTLGIEPALIFPVGLLGNNALTALNSNNLVRFELQPLLSFRAGINLRYDLFRLRKSPLSNQFSLCSGMYFSQRRWRALVEDIGQSPSGFIPIGKDELRFIAYEIPLMLQLHLRASEQIWLQAGTGTALEFFPSHAYVPDEALTTPPHEGYWVCYLARKQLLVPAFRMQLGAEWRTEKAGYFGLGIMYHLPLPRMGDAFWRADVRDETVHPYPSPERPAGNPDLPMRVSGSYFSLELKYFLKPSRGRLSQNFQSVP
ncbi:MAG: hypothetical protein N2110_10275 [Flavobacteriales bacterium]|nr:hypothetical protein [Flavobacteriales bacterium]MCX7769385.1 hypothetical protein [Flavobacteriales bacterium]MDW8409454.1 hypothetical protein [Flavobacteriales bacterium]